MQTGFHQCGESVSRCFFLFSPLSFFWDCLEPWAFPGIKRQGLPSSCVSVWRSVDWITCRLGLRESNKWGWGEERLSGPSAYFRPSPMRFLTAEVRIQQIVSVLKVETALKVIHSNISEVWGLHKNKVYKVGGLALKVIWNVHNTP